MDVPPALARLRRFPLHGALLLFDRDSGLNVLLDGDETAALRPVAPRVVQFAITNRCNLACTFCSRDTAVSSMWTADSAFDVLAGLAQAGVLEVAFGGGEPWAFRGFSALVRRLYAETPLAVNITTNGLLARPDEIAGCYGQIRVSLYDDNDWRTTLARMRGARYGVNYLVTPARLPELETTLLELVELGCADILLLSYNGRDAALHLSPAQAADLARRVAVIARALPRTRLAIDVCWGERLEAVPKLLDRADCGAGSDFLVVTSDRRVMPCSFHQVSYAVANAEDILAVWRDRRSELASASTLPGCARTPGFGIGGLR